MSNKIYIASNEGDENRDALKAAEQNLRHVALRWFLYGAFGGAITIVLADIISIGW